MEETLLSLRQAHPFTFVIVMPNIEGLQCFVYPCIHAII